MIDIDSDHFDWIEEDKQTLTIKQHIPTSARVPKIGFLENPFLGFLDMQKMVCGSFENVKISTSFWIFKCSQTVGAQSCLELRSDTTSFGIEEATTAVYEQCGSPCDKK